MGSLTVGRGTEHGVAVGRLIDEAAQRKVTELVDEAVALGAKILTGGRPVPGSGYFFPPTVLTGVNHRARITTEEIFGPVAPLLPFENEQ